MSPELVLQVGEELEHTSHRKTTPRLVRKKRMPNPAIQLVISRCCVSTLMNAVRIQIHHRCSTNATAP